MTEPQVTELRRAWNDLVASLNGVLDDSQKSWIDAEILEVTQAIEKLEAQ